MEHFHRCSWVFTNQHRLGTVLLELGLVDEEQLWHALEESAAAEQRLGQVVFRLGLVTAEQLAQALTEQARLRKELGT